MKETKKKIYNELQELGFAFDLSCPAYLPDSNLIWSSLTVVAFDLSDRRQNINFTDT